jgi:hypothetical protein
MVVHFLRTICMQAESYPVTAQTIDAYKRPSCRPIFVGRMDFSLAAAHARGGIPAAMLHKNQKFFPNRSPKDMTAEGAYKNISPQEMNGFDIWPFIFCGRFVCRRNRIP